MKDRTQVIFTFIAILFSNFISAEITYTSFDGLGGGNILTSIENVSDEGQLHEQNYFIEYVNTVAWLEDVDQLLELQSTKCYKLRLSNLKEVRIPGILLPPLHNPAVLVSKSLYFIADPNDASTWSIGLVERMEESNFTLLAEGKKRQLHL
jgi:hypothetical protein